jgi:hypothetical protein
MSVRAARLSVAGVASTSPLGSLLASSVSDVATIVEGEDAPVAMNHWLRCVRGTSLQWWGSEWQIPTQTPECERADIAVDFFGHEIHAPAERRWRVVDAAGESILNPFCFIHTCSRAPFVASIFLIEANPGDRNWSIIAEAHIRNGPWYKGLLDRAGRVAAHLIRSGLMRDGGTHRRPYQARIANPCRSRIGIAAGLVKDSMAGASQVLREIAFKEYWAIGQLDAPLKMPLRSGAVTPNRWIRPRNRNAYFADPFPLPERSDTFLCERYDRRARLGSIRVLKLIEDDIVDTPLEFHLGNRHLSYPCIYQVDGRIFVLPEMAALKEQLLFELVSENNPQVVSLVDRGTHIADPTLFHHGDFYWIAYCNQDFGIHDNLCLIYARRLEGPWIPHRKNPVKVDVRSSRPGGTVFSFNGKLYRPAQDCSAGYGCALTINEVRICTPDDFEEEPVAVLSPDPSGPFPHGLHTLSIAENQVLIDGKRLVFDPVVAWNRLHERARKRWKRVR